MDFKGKNIMGVVQLTTLFAILILYTKIGGLGMIYVAGSMELFYLIVYFFMGGIPDTMEYMSRIRTKREQFKDAAKVRRAGVLYVILATVLVELILFAINQWLVFPSGLKYVDLLIYMLMLTVPFLAVLQVIRGILQTTLSRTWIAISRLIFVVGLILGTLISNMLLGDYGAKAARLMQSVLLEHFYVMLGLIPGVLFGTVAAIIFLLAVWYLHRAEVSPKERLSALSKESVFTLTGQLWISAIWDAWIPCMKRVPILILLWYSLPEIEKENYLFGHFYGAILPTLSFAWVLYDMGLFRFKKKLYIAYRKKQNEVYYRDVKTVLCYVLIHSIAIAGFVLALHKSFLAIWGQQTFVALKELAAYSAFLAACGLPSLVMTEILRYRSMQTKAVLAVTAGTLCSVLLVILGAKYWGAGTLLYIGSMCVQCFVTMVVSAVCLSAVTGLGYVSVLVRSGVCVFFTAMISLLLFGVQRLVFTALGGLATLILCLGIGCSLLFVAIFVLRVFSKEDYKYFPFSYLTGVMGRVF